MHIYTSHMHTHTIMRYPSSYHNYMVKFLICIDSKFPLFLL